MCVCVCAALTSVCVCTVCVYVVCAVCVCVLCVCEYPGRGIKSELFLSVGVSAWIASAWC